MQLRIRRHGPEQVVITTAETKGVRPATTATHAISATPRSATATDRALTVRGAVRAALRVRPADPAVTLGSLACQTTWDESSAETTGKVTVTYDLLGTVTFDPTRGGDGLNRLRIRRH